MSAKRLLENGTVAVHDMDGNAYATFCTGEVAASTLDTAGEYAIGCVYLHLATGVQYKNTGTVAVPSFSVFPGVKSVSETVAYSAFTDGGSTAGTYEFTTDIPKGAVVVQSFITDVTGFAGDTSAVITIGDGTDADRYNTGTPNVFATATDISAGAVSGTAFHAAAATPTLTVTSATDFSSVSAGSVTVTIFYYEV